MFTQVTLGDGGKQLVKKLVMW